MTAKSAAAPTGFWEDSELPRSASEARVICSSRYFTGKPCKHGHVAPRTTNKGNCSVCQQNSHIRWLKENAGKAAEYSKRWMAKQDGYHKGWYAKNAEKRRAQQKAYRSRNIETERQRGILRRAANIELARARDKVKNARSKARIREWVRSNPDKCREYGRTYIAKNPHIAKVKNSRRRALVRDCEGHFTREDVERIFAAQRGRCAACGKKRKLSIDHIVSLAKGGSNWPSNLQGLCRSCNSSKNDRDPIEFMQSRGALL